MIEVGKWQTLTVRYFKEFGVYLAHEEDRENTVLLPKKQIPEGLQPGDEIEVFIYRDSKDRLIATTNKPLLMVGEIGCLEVASVSGIGAFMKCGLERDILLPYKEQTTRVQPGKSYLVYMYVDRSERLCVSMRLYQHLRHDSEYKKDDYFTGTVYEIKEHMGAFVAVDNCFSGLIPKSELYDNLKVGQSVEGRILNVRQDGKMDLSIRRPAYLQMEVDAEKLISLLKDNDGKLPINDKSSPEDIKFLVGMSKNEFKRAVGRLLKENKIKIVDKGICLVTE